MPEAAIQIRCRNCKRLHPPNRRKCAGWDKIKKVETGCGRALKVDGENFDWWLKWTFAGRRFRMTVGLFPNREAAKKKKSELDAELTAGRSGIDERPPVLFKDLAREYIERRAQKHRRGREEERIIEKDLLPA